MNKDNYLRAARFERPDSIPMTFAISNACWHHYPQEALVELMATHPLLFPGFVPPKLPYTPAYHPVSRKDAPYRDDFGCLWQTADDGITGTVVGHPLADWSALEGFVPPDPAVSSGLGPMDWAAEARRLASQRAAGQLCAGGLRHGHTFLQLSDLRGYQNLLFDMADEEERLWQLIDLVEAFNLSIVQRYLALGVDQMSYAEDLGMQSGPMLSPAAFRKYIKPSYLRLMRPALEQGVLVHMHSDGDIRLLVDDLIEDGVQIINLQDLVNGVDWIAQKFKGRLCVELDIDRQSVTAFGTPRQVDEMILNEVRTLGDRQGGLMMIYGLYPGIPLENAKALMDAMEKYAFYFS